MHRYHVIFTGQVQGVGFRWSVQMLANKYGITGSVLNLDNGNVEAYLQGKDEDIHFLFRELFNNTRFIHIDDYVMKEVELKENERSFRVLY